MFRLDKRRKIYLRVFLPRSHTLSTHIRMRAQTRVVRGVLRTLGSESSFSVTFKLGGRGDQIRQTHTHTHTYTG